VEPRSPFEGESQRGQLPLHRITQGLMPPPPIKSLSGYFTRLSQIIREENLDVSMPVDTEGHDRNLSYKTQI
jgi:hypothetical protein